MTNFVFPTWWDNVPGAGIIGEHAIQEQTRWSKKHTANLLASNIGLGKAGSGSGIYSSGTPLATFYNPTKKPQEKMLIADLPIV